jgi:hypothetical protein
MTSPQDPRFDGPDSGEPRFGGPEFEDGHGDWDALAVGWALSALDPEDEERFADHLPGCARCTATVRESLYTVADLAYALPDEAPPPALKSRLMAAVAAEAQLSHFPVDTPPASVEESWPHGEPHPGTPGYHDWFGRSQESSDGMPASEQPPAPPTAGPLWTEPEAPGERADRTGFRGGERADAVPPRQAGRHYAAGSGEGAAPDVPDNVVPLGPRRRRRLIIGAAAAAAVAVIAALGIWNVQLRSDRNDLQRIAALREAAIQQLTANEPARVAALNAPDSTTAPRRATIVVRGNQVEVIVETLGATTSDETYWLWTLNCDNGKPSDLKPIQGFTVTQPEFSVRDIGSEPGVGTATCYALSSERGTATPKVPRDVVAIGQPR